MGTSANIIVEREDGVWESVTVNYDEIGRAHV
mgnify:CR=1 FL=1